MNAKLIAFATTAIAVVAGVYAYNQWVAPKATASEFRGKRK